MVNMAKPTKAISRLEEPAVAMRAVRILYSRSLSSPIQRVFFLVPGNLVRSQESNANI